MSEQLQSQIDKLKRIQINPDALMQIMYLSELAREGGLELELVSETQTKVKLTPVKKSSSSKEHLNQEHYIHMLFADSKKISQKLSDDFNVKPNDEISIDSFIKEYFDEEENSLDLIIKVRDSD